jgi:hypothetical protein
MLRVYYDTVIASGRIAVDLCPLMEMEAVREIERLHGEGRLKRVTRRRPFGNSGAVQADHQALENIAVDFGAPRFIVNPIVKDFNARALFDKLKAAGLQESDAKHVVNAVNGDCQYFVTLDTRDILPHKAAIESVCPICVMKPTELIVKLGETL